MKKLLLFVFTVLLLVCPRPALAQYSEEIRNYDTTVTIHTDGTLGVTETIQYYFFSPRHGIIRSIPVVKTNDNGKRYKMDLEHITVKDENGKSYRVQQSSSGDDFDLKVGDPNRTLTGLHTYVIDYAVRGALTYFPGHDELYWNAVGTEWTVPVVKTTTKVILPADVTEKDFNAVCYVGASGSDNQNCTIQKKPDSVEISSNATLSAYQGLAFAVGIPKGMVAVLEPTEVVPFFSTLLGKITLAGILIFAFLWFTVLPFYIIYRWWRYGRDPRPTIGEASVWFSPPKTKSRRDLTPAETGALVDETVDMRDIYAAIVDLARRGYFKIIETKTRVILRDVPKFTLHKLKSWDSDPEIQTFEKQLLDGIFKTKDVVKLADLNLYTTIEKVKSTLYASMVTEGFFASDPNKIRILYTVLSVFALTTGNIFLFIVCILFGMHMPRKTLFGAEQAVMARSLKSFLTSQEKKLKFQAEKQMMFEKLLPYAVAFGVEEIWASRFKDIDLKNPDWYQSSSGSHFNTMVFAHAIGSGMQTSFASSVSSSSSSGFSSGFSSGGGSSGGGGGGGGGGSW